MPGLSRFNKHFAFKVCWFLLMLTGVFILSSLGFWQLHRAEEKRLILEKNATQSLIAPVEWKSGENLPVQYARISLSGNFLPHLFLLDNQHGTNHQFGFHVISPLLLADGKVILIDRGWVPGDISRRVFPIIDTPVDSLSLQGMTWYPSLLPWALGPMAEKKGENLTIIEHIDTKMIGKILQKDLYPFIMRLHKTEKYGFEREWVLVSMSPDRHKAYALQWFAMAVVLFLIYAGLSFRKNT